MTNEPTNAGQGGQTTGQGSGQTGVPGGEGARKMVTTVTAGTLIMGTYEIERLINSGGMGEVYRGRNIHNGEPVAIKIVLPSLAHDTKIVALFQKESTTLSRLSHEAIVRYHVFTVDPTIGRPCMVMEFVSGTALADRLEQGPMPVDEVRTMLRRVASGLDKAHRAGVVHRDLSPDNVILEEGSVEHAKLIDFGIAKSTSMGAGTLLGGQFAGKFNWVAPEQLGAFGGTVDGRSDIYSLALVAAAASRGAVLQMGASIVDAVGKRASVPDLTGVDPELVPLLSWMLQPDPAMRPESMAKVMAAIDNPALTPAPVAAEPKGIDPNRTVIGGALPPLDLPPAPAPQTAPPTAEAAPQTAPPGWDMPPARPQTAAPAGATVIASAPPRVAAQAAAEEPDDVSPFGAPAVSAPKATPQVATAVPEKKGKGGLIAAVAVVALAGGGAGAYFAGVFDPKPAPVAEQQTQTASAEDTTASDAAAAKKAEADATAAAAAARKKAEADAAQKAAADAAAQKAAEEKAAADKAAAEKAAVDKAAAEKAAAEKIAADKAAAEKAAADKAAAAKAAAAQADPVARQTGYLASYAAPACVVLRLQEAKADGFALDGFATDTKPLEDLSAGWKAATETTPDVRVHLVNDAQCPVLDFANRHATPEGGALKITLPDLGEVVKSGGTVSGTVEGLNGRPFTLFLVSEAGGATNLQQWVAQSSDGTASFSFTVSLAKGAPPAPQLLLAIATDKPLPKLAAVPNGVTAKSLMPFIDLDLKGSGQTPSLGLGFFRLEN